MIDLEKDYIDSNLHIRTIEDKLKMIGLEKDYIDLDLHIKAIEQELKRLEKNSKVKKYINLKNQSTKLNEMKSKTYESLKKIEFSNCKHILVSSILKSDSRGRIYKICGCVKCGLNESVLSKSNDLTFEESVMLDYLKKNYLYIKGKRISVDCDLSLGKAIYTKIHDKYPNIDDNTLIKYFERSLAHIRKNKVSEDRKNNRAKRLSLTPGFNSWDVKDAIVDRGRL